MIQSGSWFPSSKLDDNPENAVERYFYNDPGRDMTMMDAQHASTSVGLAPGMHPISNKGVTIAGNGNNGNNSHSTSAPRMTPSSSSSAYTAPHHVPSSNASSGSSVRTVGHSIQESHYHRPASVATSRANSSGVDANLAAETGCTSSALSREPSSSRSGSSIQRHSLLFPVVTPSTTTVATRRTSTRPSTKRAATASSYIPTVVSPDNNPQQSFTTSPVLYDFPSQSHGSTSLLPATESGLGGSASSSRPHRISATLRHSQNHNRARSIGPGIPLPILAHPVATHTTAYGSPVESSSRSGFSSDDGRTSSSLPGTIDIATAIAHWSGEGRRSTSPLGLRAGSTPSASVGQSNSPGFSSPGVSVPPRGMSVPSHPTNYESRGAYSLYPTSPPSPASNLALSLSTALNRAFPSGSTSPAPPSPSGLNTSTVRQQRSRQPSASSSVHPQLHSQIPTHSNPKAADLRLMTRPDQLAEVGAETGTDLASASDTGGPSLSWDVRETNKLLSAVDAEGRRMINQYVRIGELGRGQYGRVWLCEDSITGEMCAVKVVSRENKRNKSLRRAQAEAEALRQQQADEAMEALTYSARGLEPNDEHEDEPDTSFGRTSSGHGHANDVAGLAVSLRPRARTTSEGASSFADPSSGRPSSDGTFNRSSDFDHVMQLNHDLNDAPAHMLHRNASKRRRPVMDEKVKQEIAIMKRLHHPHVVRLKEVIDDRKSKKIFMVLEYMPGGHITWTENNRPTMTVDEVRSVFRDVVLGLEYLHHQGIIHRDIKPPNLLCTGDRKTVKIADFGVSHVSEALARTSATNPNGGKIGPTDERGLRKTEGTPSFFAPELCGGFESTPMATPSFESRSTFGHDLDRTTSRPEYFNRKQSGRSPMTTPGEHSYRPPGLTPMTPTAGQPINRPLSVHVQDKARSGKPITISHPLTAQQLAARREGNQFSPPVIGKGIDVWALGVTLFCLLFGYMPFHYAEYEHQLYDIIPRRSIVIPPTMGVDELPTGSGVDATIVESDPLYEEGREVVDLLSRLLDKDSTTRIHLHEVKQHPWVLRNLGDSQGWLAEHDLAETRVVRVTEDEVKRATSERTASTIPSGGLKASIKRFGEMFGIGGQGFLRKSTRRDRSKSVSSTSASITTASAWDGVSEASRSRGASRQASIVKKKPSVRSTRTYSGDAEEMEPAIEHQEMDTGALFAHAAALKRKLTYTKAAQNQRESALSTSSSPPSHASPMHFAHAHSTLPTVLARSLSGDSHESHSMAGQRLPQVGSSVYASHLLPPVQMARRSSATASDISSSSGLNLSTVMGDRSVSTPSRQSASTNQNSRRASHILSQSVDNNAGSDAEKKHFGGLRNAWNKLRSGSRTPAANATPVTAKRPGFFPSQSARPAPRTSVENDRTEGFSTAANVHGYPLTDVQQAPKVPPKSAAVPTIDQIQQIKGGVSTGIPLAIEDSSSDSTDSHSDNFEDDDDEYGEVFSPVEAGEVTQPSSVGATGPLLWADANGWQASSALTAADPLSKFLERNSADVVHVRHPSDTFETARPTSSSREDETTPRAGHKLSLRGPADQQKRGRHPNTEATSAPPGRPPISRDGSLQKDYTTRVAASPARMSAKATAAAYVADDENEDDDDEEKEVMIKPRSRARRGTDVSAGHSRPVVETA